MYGALMCEVATRNVLRARLPRLVIYTGLSFVLSMTIASAQYCTPDQCDECNLCRCSQRCCYELPELWLVNTRCAPRCKNLDNGFNCLIYKRYDRKCCRWVKESRESFLAQESTKPTLFYSHGNSLNHKNAMKSCWLIYCKMRCCPGPKRLVFWSWPAERVFKTERLRVREMIKKNLRIKYVYAEYQGYYMAKLVNQMSLSQRVMMSGHSYGAITSAAAAHLIGGGCLRGLVLEGGAAVERPNLRAAMISGAFDHDMLNPGNRYGQTFVAAEKVYVTRNIKDRTLKKWPKTSWRCKRAIGVLGVNANCLGEYRNKLCQQTMTSDVGTSHYLKPHLKSTRFVAALCCLSFPACDQCSTIAADLPTEPEIVDEAQLATMVASILDDDESEHTSTIYMEEYDAEEPDGLSIRLASDLNEMDIADIFTQDDFRDGQDRIELVNAEPLLLRPLTNAADANRTVAVHTTSPDRRQTQHAEAQPQSIENSEASNNNIWYRGGLLLAIVLTGQVYVVFSKRISAS